MKRSIVILMCAFIVLSLNSYSQTKTTKSKQKTTKEQTVKDDSKNADTPSPGDEVVPGQKGPDGQPVYQGSKGGKYYISKSGHKTYLKTEDNAVTGTNATKTKEVRTKSKTEVSKETKTVVNPVKSDSKSEVKSTSTASTVKDTDKPGAGDNIVAGEKGPDGQAVYEGSKGGKYYISKSGHKTYLKTESANETKLAVNPAKSESKTEVKSYGTVPTPNDNEKPGPNDKIIDGKTGPQGQPVYLGPRGGEYYINKNGNRTYLKADKK